MAIPLEDMEQSRPNQINRNQNLDLLRAMAIMMVVIFHTVQMSPHPLPEVMKFAQYGRYGVELFFVLSGWLIGGLYWKELSQFGNVQLLRFWQRRWLRTIPPYLLALSLSWGAVWIARREPFDFGYLFFVQNYYSQIPFFLVSWSLCIEEHFYLVTPVLILLLSKTRRRNISGLFLVLAMFAPLGRLWVSKDGIDSNFGFERTATHLHFEGLFIGFWLAFLRNQDAGSWRLLVKISPFLAIGSLIAIGVSMELGDYWMYNVGLSAISVAFASILVFMADRKPSRIAEWQWVKALALSSYSVYLVHPLVIHFSREVVARVAVLPWWFYFPVTICCMWCAGAAFYLAFECGSIRLRDLWVPRRPGIIR